MHASFSCGPPLEKPVTASAFIAAKSLPAQGECAWPVKSLFRLRLTSRKTRCSTAALQHLESERAFAWILGPRKSSGGLHDESLDSTHLLPGQLVTSPDV